MNKLSVIVPCRDEPYLHQTVQSLLDGAAGDIEVVVVLDGPQEYSLPDDRRVRVLWHDEPKGRRAATNTAVHASKGKWLMKIDAHCVIKQGYDEVLKADCADNWVMIPRRYGLDAPNWTIINDQKPEDAMAYMWPFQVPSNPSLKCRPWPERAQARGDVMIDEDMGFQGSCWFMSRAHWDRIGEMQEEGYGSFVSEAEEIGFRTWLGPWDGRVMRNKKTYYAHYAKPKAHWQRLGPGHIGWITEKEWFTSWRHTVYFWLYNKWEERGHDFEWLIERFWPLPRWPDDWRVKVARYG